MKKKYKEFMGGSDGTSIEELIKGNLEDVNQIKKLSIKNENNIKDIYESSLRNDIKAKVAAKGYNAKNIKLEIEDDEEYTLKKIDIEIYKNMEKDKKDIETIQNVDINISQKSTENDMQEKLSEKDKRKLKDYLSGVYEIDEKNININ